MWNFSRKWHSIAFFLIVMIFFPQRPTLHWTRGRGDILWMKPLTLYRYLKSCCPHSLNRSFNITNFQSLPLKFPNYTLAAFNTSQFLNFSVLAVPFSPSYFISGCLSARGVWGQKGLLALVGLLRRLAPPPPFSPSACYSMVCLTDLLSCMNLTELLLFPVT